MPLSLHEKAVEEGQDFYQDPESGLWVATKLVLLRRGYCCDTGCRHCPYKTHGAQETTVAEKGNTECKE